MGDVGRNRVFARFIETNFPKRRFPSVCCVADGKMELALALAQRGYHVTVVEPRMRKTPAFGNGKWQSRLVIRREVFSGDSDVPESVVIGMHPDEATSEIVLAAKRLSKPFAVVPCCFKGRYSADARGDSKRWLAILRGLYGSSTMTTQLNMTGKNLVLFSSR